MLTCVDVDYRLAGAWAGLLIFERWDDPYASAAPECFLSLSLAEPIPLEEIAYHVAFEAGLAENKLGRVEPVPADPLP